MGENCITCDVVLGLGFVLRVYGHSLFGRPSGGVVFLFFVFTRIVFSVGPPGAWPFCFSFLPAFSFRNALRGARSFYLTFLPAAFSNWRPPVAPSFAARRKIEEKGVSRGCGPLNPRGNVLGHSDVLCANRLAMVRVTRLRRLRRSAYPLASACCGCPE